MSQLMESNLNETAIINIDLQVDYCSPQGKLSQYFKNIDEKLGDTSPIETLLPRLIEFNEILRTKGMKQIVWIRMIEDEKEVPPNCINKENHLDLCSRGTEGFEYYEVIPQEKDLEFIKTQYNAFTNNYLDIELKRRGIKNVILTGVMTSRCVRSTFQGALERGYRVFIAKDLVGMFKEQEKNHESALDDMSLSAVITSSQELLDVYED